MSSRQRMTMRATIERDSASAGNWGSSSKPTWTTLTSNLACYAYVSRGGTRHGTDATVETQVLVVLVPLGTDVTANDRISTITDRQGTELFGKHYVDRVNRRKLHIELTMRRGR